MAGRTRLFRAVTRAELSSLLDSGRFSNLPGFEVKYFAATFAEAQAYALLAVGAYKEGPMTIVETSIRTSLVTRELMVQVDGGIDTVVLDTRLLAKLAPPIIKSARAE